MINLIRERKLLICILVSLSTSIWLEAYKYLRICILGIVGDQMGSSPLLRGDLSCVHGMVRLCDFIFKQMKTFKTDGWKLILQRILPGLNVSLFQVHFLWWRVTNERVRATDAGLWLCVWMEGHERWGCYMFMFCQICQGRLCLWDREKIVSVPFRIQPSVWFSMSKGRKYK